MAEAASNVPVTGVAVTALGVALIRARESARADRLYDDPPAQVFATAARAGFDDDHWTGLHRLADQFYPGRTVAVRLVDDRIQAAADAGIRQFVLLGAGLDTRAYRMRLPADLRLFEIDLPELFAFKEPVLAAARPICDRRVVIADLRADWRKNLLDNGFQPDTPTCWIDEGTLGSPAQDWAQQVIRTLTELSAPGSCFDVSRFDVDHTSAPYRELRNLVSGTATPPAPEPPFDPEPWLDSLGWNTEFRRWTDMVAPLGRDLGDHAPHSGSIAAIRR
ncbi:SAM-dependent methyltransferase [Nocardia sp. NPDC127579]|uniref:SAM-dependent methyltransferase n=1 Tax=Nocardia sp. NPDC127579 TaxID=3345402 RepID=UPI00362D45F2